jgi:hypothetical protein
MRFALMMVLLCAGWSAHGANPPTNGFVKITGRTIFKTGRQSRLPEFRIEQFRQLVGDTQIPETSCINAVFSSSLTKTSRLRLRFNKRTMVAEGKLIDFMDNVRADPIGATVSSFQNECRNKYVLVVTKITR